MKDLSNYLELKTFAKYRNIKIQAGSIISFLIVRVELRLRKPYVFITPLIILLGYIRIQKLFLKELLACKNCTQIIIIIGQFVSLDFEAFA